VGSFGWRGGGGPRLGGSGGLFVVGSLGSCYLFTWRCVASEGFRLPLVWAHLGSFFIHWRWPVGPSVSIFFLHNIHFLIKKIIPPNRPGL
jgi:hypothetical protein